MKQLLLLFTAVIMFNACAVKDFNRFEKNEDSVTIIKQSTKKEILEDKLFEWKIQNGDRVEIQAFNQTSGNSGQLSTLLNNGGQKISTTRVGDEGILINSTGLVNLPLIGSVKLGGLTEHDAGVKLMDMYKKFLRDPFVSVKILNQRIFVLGEVKNPGVQLVNHGTMSLIEALALSGDITDYANRTNIRIIRGDMDKPEVREIDMTDYKSMTMASLVLRPNDLVYVEAREDRASMVGYQEEQPWVSVLTGLFQPFATAALAVGALR